MKVTGVRCLKCGDFIYSRAGHDFRGCSCGNVAVDGGQDGYYSRIIGAINSPREEHDIPGVTLQDLYDDWNYQTNKFGRIKKEK